MAREKSDGIFSFVMGLTAGLLGGAVLGLLFAPKSGDELREDLQDMARKLPDKINDEIKNPKGKTREFIEKTKYNIESQIDQAKQGREASRQAKAKQAEELSSGYEYH